LGVAETAAGGVGGLSDTEWGQPVQLSRVGLRKGRARRRRLTTQARERSERAQRAGGAEPCEAPPSGRAGSALRDPRVSADEALGAFVAVCRGPVSVRRIDS